MNMLAEKFKEDSNVAFTWNGAKSFATTGNTLVDQFGKAGSYMKRLISDVITDMSVIWNEDPLAALRFMFFLRIINRTSDIGSSQVKQSGSGLRDEFYKRMSWLSYNRPEVFKTNLWLVPFVGSFKDFVELWSSYDINPSVKQLLVVTYWAVAKETESSLAWKYAPLPRAQSKLKTERAKRRNQFAIESAKLLGLTHKVYRLTKTTSEAHKWQQLISTRQYDNIDFGHIPGIALKKLVDSKFLENQHLSRKFMDWIHTQDVVKFNGYPYQLYHSARSGNQVRVMTANKQFEQLLETSKGAMNGNVLTALDSSSSMTWVEVSKGIQPLHIAMSLTAFFAKLNTSNTFKDYYINFATRSTLNRLHGITFSDALSRMHGGMGSTNFQSIIDLLVEYRVKHPEVPIEDYPHYILVISDMQFNPSYYGDQKYGDPNSTVAKQKLAEVGLEHLSFIWWQVNGKNTTDMPDTLESGQSYFFSGFSGDIIRFLLGGSDSPDHNSRSMVEVVQEALNQPILQYLKLG